MLGSASDLVWYAVSFDPSDYDKLGDSFIFSTDDAILFEKDPFCLSGDPIPEEENFPEADVVNGSIFLTGSSYQRTSGTEYAVKGLLKLTF